MNPCRLLFWSLAAFASVTPSFLHAIDAPQDNWRTYATSSWALPGAPGSIARGPDGAIYVAVSNGTATVVQVYTPTGTLIRELGSLDAYEQIGGLAVASNGNVFVFSLSTTSIKVFDNTGILLREMGGIGTGNGLFGSVFGSTALANSLLTLDSSDNLYVADIGNRLIQKFSSDGTFLLQWGGPGTLAGQLGTGSFAIAITPREEILAVTRAATSSIALQTFTTEGVLKNLVTATGSPMSSDSALTVLPDGLVLLSRISTNYLFDESLTRRSTFSVYASGGFVADPSGKIYVATNGSPSSVLVYERSYLVENPPVYNALPQPALLASEQRPSTPYVDIDYKVVDTDDSTVEVAILGFLNGGNDLSKVLKLSTFVETTADHVGPGQPANEIRRLTWNAAADWAVEFGDVQFEILAKDGRGLMPFHWITLPVQGDSPALAISQRPVAEAEWLHLWYWLIATGDPGITLTDGQITGAGGAFEGQILATTTEGVSTTTAEGRAYLYEKLNVRAISEAELTRASAGQFGFAELTPLSVVKVEPSL